MRDETEIGGRDAAFPRTSCTLVDQLASAIEHERAHARGTLIEAYWKPVYKYLRLHLGLGNEDAKDLTQGFFTHALEREFLAAFDPSKARFRTWLRRTLDAFAANARRAARAEKRGGAALHVDFAAAEDEVQQTAPAAFTFEAEWRRALFAAAVDALRQSCTARDLAQRFEAFRRYDLASEAATRPTYQDVAHALDLSTAAVTSHLHAARQELRALVLQRLRAQSASESEFRDDLRALLGTLPDGV